MPSQPPKQPAQKTERQLFQEKLLREQQEALLEKIKKDLSAETNPKKRKNIQMCQIEVARQCPTGRVAIMAFDGKVERHETSDATIKRLWSLNAAQKAELYFVRGTCEQSMAGPEEQSNSRRPQNTQPKGPTKEQMAMVAAYPTFEPKMDGSGFTNMHVIYAIARIPEKSRKPGLNGDDLEKAKKGTHLDVSFDTGSEIQSIEPVAWREVAGLEATWYNERIQDMLLRGATGAIERRKLVFIEIGYFRDQARTNQIGQWRTIDACLSTTLFAHNLSGMEITQDFHFIIPQGNSKVIMGTNKLAVTWEYLTKSHAVDSTIKDMQILRAWAAAHLDGQGVAGSSRGRS